MRNWPGRLPRPGFTHDSQYPMQRMVRWVAYERGLEYKYKYVEEVEDYYKHLFKNGWYGWTAPKSYGFGSGKTCINSDEQNSTYINYMPE